MAALDYCGPGRRTFDGPPRPYIAAATDAIIRKVAKLRWLGHEREAAELAHARRAPPIGGSLTEPAETD